MLNAAIKFSLQHRPIVLFACLLVLGYGGYTATQMPIDVFPDLDRPRVVLLTECPGLAPEEVETQVTYPLESALLGANGVRDVRTQSGNGMSSVIVEFQWGTDIRAARQVVQERIATVAGDLPANIRPQLAPVSSILGQFLIAGVRQQRGPNGGELAPVPDSPDYAERVIRADGSPELFIWKVTDRSKPREWTGVSHAASHWDQPSPDGSQRVRTAIDGRTREIDFPSEKQRALALRTLGDWELRPRLLKVSGVAQVVVMGGGRKQYQVLVDPHALEANGVALAEVEIALRAANINFSGGYLDRGGEEKSIRVLGRLGPQPERVISDLKAVAVKAPAKSETGQPLGRPVLLHQVARITEGAQIKRGDAAINGDPGVAFTITKQPHTDARALTDACQKTLRELERTLPPDVALDPDLYELRDFIDRGVFNVGEALVVGAVLVLIVLFLFLLNVRTTFISLTAIPLSLALTAMVFELIGRLTGSDLSINVMTLGGIAVAMGELVDDAIVDVENIHRRLRENAGSEKPRPALRVVFEASAEVRTAIVFGTAVVILVFLPLFALSGVEGRLFTPLGIAYIVSILASLVVSLTVTPVLSYTLLKRMGHGRAERESYLVRALKWLAGFVVRFSLRRAGWLLVLTWLLTIYCGWRLTMLGGDFLPAFDEGTVQLSVSLPAGTSLESSVETSRLVDAQLAALMATPENPKGPIRSFVRKTGRAELDEHADPPNASDIIIRLNPDSGLPRAESLETIRGNVVANVPGIDAEIEQPLAHLISENITGSTAQISVKIQGDDLDQLERIAQKVKAAIAKIPGVSSLVIESIKRVEELHIRLKSDALAYYGFDRATVGQFVQTALQGETVSQVLEGQRRFDLVVRLDHPFRTDPNNLGELILPLAGNRGGVKLKELAEITPATGGDSGPNQVKRENLRRRIVVRCNAVGRDLDSVVTDIQATVAREVNVPTGYAIEYGGTFESQRRATRLIAGLAALSTLGMFGVLWLLFPSARTVLQILNAIPTAFIGGVFALIVTEQTMTVASLVGFISLGGIAVRNGILLVTHYLHLMKHEGEGFTESMIVRGSLERLAPVLMTALTAGLGLIPLVVAGQQPGREILYPVATVILGGLVTSTFCEFLIHPGLFWRFSGSSAVRLVAGPSADESLD